MNFFQEKNNNLILNVYIVPRSSKSEIVGIYNNSLKIKLKSPPVDGAANEELVLFLSKKLKISKSNIEIISGDKQKRKVISIKNFNSAMLRDLQIVS